MFYDPGRTGGASLSSPADDGERASSPSAAAPVSASTPAPQPAPTAQPAADCAAEHDLATADCVEAGLLGQAATLGRAEVSRAADVPVLAARKFWHALGFPVAQSTDEMFTDADVDALRRVSDLVRSEEVDEELALGLTRAFARTTDRLAVWQTQLVAESLLEGSALAGQDAELTAASRHEVADQVVRRVVGLADELEPLLVYVWRRQLAAALSRTIADADPQAPEAQDRIVGFADLVNFTSVVRRMTERELGQLVVRFETIAQDVISAHGGRLVKTVGDEVMFSHNDARAAAGIALDLVAAIAEERMLPQVRVGMASGTVLARFGDLYCTTVNRAARLTAVAPTGGVLIDEELAHRVAAVSGFQLVPERRRVLRGIGTVTPSRLRRTSGARATGEAPVVRAHSPSARPVGGWAADAER